MHLCFVTKLSKKMTEKQILEKMVMIRDRTKRELEILDRYGWDPVEAREYIEKLNREPSLNARTLEQVELVARRSII